MKTMIFVLAALFLTGAGAQTRGKEKKGGPKILVAYFSWSGNTQHVAEQIAKLTGGDLFRVETKNPYPEEYVPCTEVAKEELEKGVRPELKGKVENFDQYDIILSAVPCGGIRRPWRFGLSLKARSMILRGRQSFLSARTPPLTGTRRWPRLWSLPRIPSIWRDSEPLTGTRPASRLG